MDIFRANVWADDGTQPTELTAYLGPEANVLLSARYLQWMLGGDRREQGIRLTGPGIDAMVPTAIDAGVSGFEGRVIPFESGFELKVSPPSRGDPPAETVRFDFHNPATGRKLSIPVGAYMTAPNSAPARVICQIPTFDVGPHDPLKPVEHVFMVENVGERPARVSSLTVSCDCTTAALTDTILFPHRPVPVKVSTSFMGMLGAIDKRVSITFDDADAGGVELHVRADLRDSISCVPACVLFGRVERKQGARREIRLRADRAYHDPAALKVKTVTSDIQGVGVTLGAPENGQVVIYADIPPGTPAGAFSGNIVIETESLGLTRFSIPCMGEVFD